MFPVLLHGALAFPRRRIYATFYSTTQNHVLLVVVPYQRIHLTPPHYSPFEFKEISNSSLNYFVSSPHPRAMSWFVE